MLLVYQIRPSNVLLRQKKGKEERGQYILPEFSVPEQSSLLRLQYL